MESIVLISVYLASALVSWYVLHKNYSKGGVFYNDSPGWFDLFVVFAPLYNTSFLVVCAGGWIINKLDKYVNINKFFLIKKED